MSDGVPTALVDFDDLGNCRPNLPDYPYNHRLKAANLGVMWQNVSSVGARCLVASGVVSTREVIRMHADAVPGCELSLCFPRCSRELSEHSSQVTVVPAPPHLLLVRREECLCRRRGVDSHVRLELIQRRRRSACIVCDIPGEPAE